VLQCPIRLSGGIPRLFSDTKALGIRRNQPRRIAGSLKNARAF